MSYSIDKSALVPLLAKCLLRHGSVEAMQEYMDNVSKKGGDATITDEFIATYEIGKYEERKEMTLAAYQKAMKAACMALNEADDRLREQRKLIPIPHENKVIEWLKNKKVLASIAWVVFIAITVWLDEEVRISEILLSTMVVAATFILSLVLMGKIKPQ
jgi:hypothetical protein